MIIIVIIFDLFISFKIAEITNRWHNYGEEKIIPTSRITIPVKDCLNFCLYILQENCKYLPYASKVYYYDDVVNNWDQVISEFIKRVNFPENFNGIVNQVVKKNPENPKDFIENYDELKQEYLSVFNRLV